MHVIAAAAWKLQRSLLVGGRNKLIWQTAFTSQTGWKSILTEQQLHIIHHGKALMSTEWSRPCASSMVAIILLSCALNGIRRLFLHDGELVLEIVAQPGVVQT